MITLFKPHVSAEAILAVTDTLRSGWIGLGPKTAEFEAAFAGYVGAKHAVAMNSATSALHLSLLAKGIGPGDEVLTTSLTFVSTNEAILYCGAQPVFVDVLRDTLCIDVSKAEGLVTPRTKAIMVVHYGGSPADMDRVRRFAARHGLKVIEDAAHACGANYKGRMVGSMGTTCFSFHAVKNLPAGDGGMVTTDDDAEKAALVKLRWMGIDKSTYQRSAGGYSWNYDVGVVGYKAHMNDITASIALAHLPRLREWNDTRRAIALEYRDRIEAQFVHPTGESMSADHLCVARVPSRDLVIERLRERGIEAGVHYRPNHHYPIFSACRRGDLSETESAYREILSLPMHLGLSNKDVKTVCRELNSVLRSAT